MISRKLFGEMESGTAMYSMCMGEYVGVNEWVFLYGEPSLKHSEDGAKWMQNHQLEREKKAVRVLFQKEKSLNFN